MKTLFFGRVLGCIVLLLIAILALFPGLADADSQNNPDGRILATSESDSLALVAFFHGTDGRNWTNKTNWLSGPVATWFGVTVTNGRVTRLEMPSNYVRFAMPRADPNQIPPEIGDLTMLEVLDLHFNGLNADVPAEIGNLANLKVLNLAGNGIGGPLPPEIGNLAQLEFLDLSRNQIGGKLPGEIGNLLRLRELYLYRNYQLKGVIPEGVDRMMQLETVDISQNRLEDLPDLSSLDPVSGNGSLVSVKIDENHFSFEDIEPNIGHSFQFSYASQYFGGSSKDALVYEGDSLIITYDIGGEYNTYQWYRDDEAIVGETSDRYVVGPVTRDAAGVYRLEIKNTLVTDLTLTTPNQDIKYEEEHSAQWLDVGSYHHAYNESGARHWSAQTPTGREYPAIQRYSSHAISSGFWVGIKDWTDAHGTHYPYYVARMGPNESGAFYTYPIQNKLIGRYADTIVEVNGEPSFDKEAILDDVDPGLPADRMVHNIYNLSMGIEVDRKAYAYTNEYHDNYHIIEYTYCNTGNIDDDEEIELPEQTLHDVIFYRMNRWRGNEQAARLAGGIQHILGRYTIFDTVGDGYEEYPVDFTAQYAWLGSTLDIFEPNASRIGIPLFSDEQPPYTGAGGDLIAPGDSIGRLAGVTMMGHSVIHADRSSTDPSYDRAQPAFMAWINNDDSIYRGRTRSDYSIRASHEEMYELGIVGPFPSPKFTCTDCRRAYPHYADINQPDGMFWGPQDYDLTGWMQGGSSMTTGYGPYEIGPGECIHITESEGVGGLSFDASMKIGRAFKRGGRDRDSDIIEYDANGDGVIDTTPFDYDNVFVGTEAQTKGQWVLTARDSLFKTFVRGRDVYQSSSGMTQYPIAEPPRPPLKFTVWGRPDHIGLAWETAPDGPEIHHWEVYRTEGREDNLYVTGCTEDLTISCGYERIATLPAQTNAFADLEVSAGTEYFYYIQAIGESQPIDDAAVRGTPGGIPLRSGRYLTQTYTPVSLQSGTALDDEGNPLRFNLEGNYPNPFSDKTTIRYVLPEATDVDLTVYDILGREVGMLIQGYQVAGLHEYTFNGSSLANGIYIYVLNAGEHRAEGKMVILR